MNKETFDTMTLNEQLDYINNRLQTDSMRAISTDLGIHKNTIPLLLKKSNYVYDKVAKQYVKNEALGNEVVVTVDHSQANKPTPKVKQDTKPIFSIPTKTKTKTTTKAFNVVMKESLVNKIDELATEKGYSRNQLINYMLEVFVKNLDK